MIALATQATSAGGSDLPAVPETIRELMADRKYDEAVTAIDKALADKPKGADYLRYLKGRALHLAGKHRESVDTLVALERDLPQSPWIRRARFARAASLVKLRDLEGAEKIFETEAQYLLSTERKSEIAGIYLEFADSYFKPTEKDKHPNYEKALQYYRQALAVGPGPAKRLETEFRIARSMQELGQHEPAIAAFNTFLKDHPKSDFDIEVRYQLGKVQLHCGRQAEARRAWKDLLDLYANAALGAEARDRLADAAYGMAHTYGLPTPSSKEDLELGAAAAGRFIAAYPDHKLAPRAALEVAQAYFHHGRHDESIVALKKLIAEPKYAASDVLPDARQLLGQVYRQQKKFTLAISAWQEYLTKHPSHKSWADVQQAIIDTEFESGLEARQNKDFAGARKIWQEFLVKYPLSERSAYILLEFGLMSYDEEKYDDAIDHWKRLASKYPDRDEASRAQYLIGLVQEHQQGKFEEALLTYRRLTQGSFVARAQDRVARLTRQDLSVVTPRVFRSGQPAVVKVTTRNVKQVTVKAYQIDLETYFRKMHLARGVEGLNIALIDPDKSWTFEIPKYADHKQITSDIEIPLTGPGVMAVTVISEPKPNEKPPVGLVIRPQEATTMVVMSDLDILVKSSRNELFVYAQNMKTGKPQAGARLLVSDGAQVFAEGTTNAEGVFIGSVPEGSPPPPVLPLLRPRDLMLGALAAGDPLDKTWEPLKTSRDIRVFAMLPAEGAKPAPAAGAAAAPATPPAHVASSVLGLAGLEFASGITPKGFLYTDRPAYRAGHLVHVKGLIRWVKGDQYVFEAGKKFRLDVYDSRGRQIRNEEVTLGEFGTFAANFQLAAEAPQGEYRLHLSDPAAPEVHSYSGRFSVQEYKLEPIQLSVETPRKVYYRGEEVTATVKLRYYYGLALAGREIRYRLPDGSVQTAKTDAAGAVEIKFDTRQFREDQPLDITAEFPERNLAARANVFLAVRAFSADVKTIRDVYIVGETFDVTLTTTDAAGEKTGQKMTLNVIERTIVRGQSSEKQVAEHAVPTDDKTGVGKKTISVEKAGEYILRASGTDRFGNPVSSERLINVSGEEDAVRLRILADKHHFSAGDKATVNVHWRDKPQLALITYQGARVLGYRLVELKQGMNALEIPLTESLAPNFDLFVSVMSDTGGERKFGAAAQAKPEASRPVDEKPLVLPSFHQASSAFEVERPLMLTLKPSKDKLKPGEEVEVVVTTTDPQGKPIAAEVSLAMIEQNLLARFPDQLPALAEFFQAGHRVSSLRTISSCTFRYAPRTKAISDSLLEEAERIALQRAEEASRERPLAVNRPFGDQRDDAPNPVDAPRVVVQEEEENLGVNDADDLVRNVEEQRQMAEQVLGNVQYDSFSADLDADGQFALPGPGGGGGGAPANGNGQRRAGGLIRQQVKVIDQRTDFSRMQQSAGDRRPNEPGRPPATPPAELTPALAWFREADGDSDNLTRMSHRYGMALSGKQVYSFGRSSGGASGASAADVSATFPVHETGYWNPRIVTDKDGKATVKFLVPERSTAWRLTARGITTGALSGQSGADLVAKKDLFGELTLPLAFVEGDSTQVIATVHNDALATGKIEVTLKTTIGGKVVPETKTIDVKAKGLVEVSFPRKIEGAGEATFELTVKAAALEDVHSRTVPVRPYGVPVYAAIGGSAEANFTAWVSPPAGLDVKNPNLSIVIGPSIERSLLDIPLGTATVDHRLYYDRALFCGSGLERTTSDLLATVGALKLLGETREKGSPEGAELSDRARATIGFLVSSQNDDGGWSWSGGKGKSDRESSARALWALSLARKAGFIVPEETFNKAVTNVQAAFTAAGETDYRGKSILLFALTASGKDDFAYANRLYRSRPSLTVDALVYLALTFVEMDRQEIARELLDLAAGKLPVLKPNKPVQPGVGDGPGTARPATDFYGVGLPSIGDAEVRALYLLALQRIAPADAKVRETADWLLAHRTGVRWAPERATGPAALALSGYFGQARFAGEKYKLSVFVNDERVAELDIDPAVAASRVIEVPANLLPRGEKLPGAGDARRQRIQFELNGRGRFTYQCVLGGFVAADGLKNVDNKWHVETRVYEAAQLEFDGREIPRGFDVVEGSYTTWINKVTQLPVGKRTKVRVNVHRGNHSAIPDHELDYLVVTEPIPSGAQVIEGSVAGEYERYELGPGSITFYVGNRRYPGVLSFDLYGYSAGEYRVAPTIVRSYYQPQRIAVNQVGALKVLAAGEKSADEYKLTPRELYELGKRSLEKKDLITAALHLTSLFDKHQLKPEIYKETAQMLLDVSLASKRPAEIVRYFEILKEKYPELEIDFEKIFQVGAAYRDMNEYERSYLVFRAIAEASFQRESQVAGFLDGQGEFERSIAVMDRILREYPPEPYIASATYALTQQVYAKAPHAATDPALRAKGITKVDLIREAIARLDGFLTAWPDDPAADEASFSLASALVELESWPVALARAEKFAARYPKSSFVDSYWYVMGYSHFALGQHKQALEMCLKVAQATTKEAGTGRDVESRNKWRAIYIMGQIYHALGQAVEAIREYEKVVERFADAREAIEYFNRKAIALEEVTTLRPGEKAEVELKFRNVAEVEVKVYRIDLMKFSLLERDLSGITRINLSGIRPLVELKVPLGDGKDFREKTKKLELPLAKEGAYLIVCRGENLHASGLALVTPLAIEVQEEGPSGRVRATVKNRVTDKSSAAVNVKVIGTRNDRFTDGQTDLRGVFVADGIAGKTTVIARAGDGQYAFHRGTLELGAPVPAPNAAPAQQPAEQQQQGQQQKESLLEDLLQDNKRIQDGNNEKLQQLYKNPTKGVKTKAAF